MPTDVEAITIWSLFTQADIVVKATMGLLGVFSLWSWAVAVDKWLQFGDLDNQAKRFERAFWSGQSIEELDDRVSDRPRDAMGRVFSAMSREWREVRRGGQMTAAGAALLQTRVDRLMQAQVAREVTRAGRGLGVLATVGSTAPFVGLFGTVWGIMTTFRDIANQQQTTLAVVAPGIAEALVATALGLIAAIPAVVFYNKFASDLDQFADRLENFADEVAARLSRRLGERA